MLSDEQRRVKEPPSAAEIAVSTGFNAFYLTLALIDYSVAVYAREHDDPVMLTAFTVWKNDAPVLEIIMMALLLTLPFVLFNLARSGIYHAFTHDAHIVRHTLDFVSFAALVVVLYHAFLVASPIEGQLTALYEVMREHGAQALSAAQREEVREATGMLATLYSGTLVLNVCLFAIPIVLYLLPAEYSSKGKQTKLE